MSIPKRRSLVPPVLLVTLTMQLGAGSAEHSCPPGQVLGSSGHCVFKDQCPDGSLPRNGKCYSVDATPPQPVVKKPQTCKTTLAQGVPKAPNAGCGAKTPPTAHRVFLANGKATEVFMKYLEDAEHDGVKIGLGHLTVYFFDSKNEQRSIASPKMGLAHYFSGKSLKDLWKRSLDGEIAQPRENPIDDAHKLDADVACGD